MSEPSNLEPWEMDPPMASSHHSNATTTTALTTNTTASTLLNETLPPTRPLLTMPPPSLDELLGRNQPPTTTKKTNATTLLYFSPYTIFLVVGVLVLVVTRCIQMCQVRRTRRRRQLEAQARLQSMGFAHGNTLLYNGVAITLPGSTTTPVFLDLEDRTKLYQRTFEKAKLVHTLTSEDFEVCNESSSNNDDKTDSGKDIESAGEQQDYSYDDDEAPWIYLPFHNDSDNHNNDGDNNDKAKGEKSTIHEKTKDEDNGNLSDSEREEISTQEQQHSPAAVDSADTNADLESQNITIPKTKIPGTCVVCFEHFEIGERVVCSQNLHECKHVFHEECMARFLASNSTRTKYPNYSSEEEGTSYSENPCPTCRQPFCKVPHEDIVRAIILKSVKVALRENNNSNNNDDGNTNNDAEGDDANSILDVENPSGEDANARNEDADDDDDDATHTVTASEDSSDEGANEEIRVRLSSDETTDIPIADV